MSSILQLTCNMMHSNRSSWEMDTFQYSVTQSKSNILLGDVVLDGFNMVYRDEDRILDQTYHKQICSDFYPDDL